MIIQGAIWFFLSFCPLCKQIKNTHRRKVTRFLIKDSVRDNHFQKYFMVEIFIQFRFSENATKIWRVLVWRLHQTFVAFSKNMNVNRVKTNANSSCYFLLFNCFSKSKLDSKATQAKPCLLFYSENICKVARSNSPNPRYVLG